MCKVKLQKVKLEIREDYISPMSFSPTPSIPFPKERALSHSAEKSALNPGRL
jgi:hypothetical protein